MIKSFIISVFILLCSSLIESCILSNIIYLSVIPDLSLICIIYFSLENGKLLGESTGFVSGLFIDFITAAPFGLNCLFRTIIGYFCGIFNKTITTDGIFVPCILGFSVTILKGLLLFVIGFLFPNKNMYFHLISFSFLLEILLNTILTPFVFKLLNLFKKYLVLKPENII